MDAVKFISFVAGLEVGRQLSDDEIKFCIAFVRELLKDADLGIRLSNWKPKGSIRVDKIIDLEKIKPD